MLQFGTGVLLRGLPDFLIDKANKQGSFNGSIVIVKSTDSDASDFAKQDCLYTILERGIVNGASTSSTTVITSVSRLLDANTEWNAVLECAANPNMQIIISNTTEVGIQYIQEDWIASPPRSYPAKLIAFLWERFVRFNGAKEAGMVILPTELISNNGDLLKSIIIQHLEANKNVGKAFGLWVLKHNHFCNTLVDRIVPGAIAEPGRSELFQSWGYQDHLAIQAEPYLLWAIEGSKKVKDKLSFAKADKRTVITKDITGFREQKLRLLNGGHTISVCMAILAGLKTVNEMMEHPTLGKFVENVIQQEILPTIVEKCPTATEFAKAVIDRFKNPYIAHPLINITLQCTSKMNARNAETILRYQHQFHRLPELMLNGMVSYLLFTRPIKVENGKYYGVLQGQEYIIKDDQAPVFLEAWNKLGEVTQENVTRFVQKTFSHPNMFDQRLKTLDGFIANISEKLFNQLSQ